MNAQNDAAFLEVFCGIARVSSRLAIEDDDDYIWIWIGDHDEYQRIISSHEEGAAMTHHWLDRIKWTADGLVPAVAQDADSGRILMMAWMNRESLQRTVECGEAVYWSRSRQALWHKGEISGHTQKVRSIRLDCDADVLLVSIEQIGGIACHTGRQSCFFEELQNGAWIVTDPVLKDPREMYGS